MKITKFDPNYPWKLGDTTLAQGGGVSVVTGDSGSTGGSTGAAGGDLAGTLPDPTVVGIQGTPVDALPAIATDYLDGTGHWSTPTGSGTGYVTNVGGGKEVINTIAASGASHTLDLSLGNVQDLTLTASCTLTFSGATAGVFCSFELFLRQDGTGGWATTWPGSVVWPGGTPPTLTTTPSTVTVLAFGSEDGGTTWYGFPSHGGGGSLEVKEVDGSPDVTGVTIIRVSNGSLTDDGGGQVTITTGGGGGAGTLTTLPIVPALSSASYGGYIASADEAYSTGPAYGAFSATPGVVNVMGMVGWLSNGGALPHYVRIQLPAALVATQYEVMPWWVDNYPGRAPKTWTFEGSNNGTSWTTLDTQTNFTSWVAAQLRVLFAFSNSTAYSYYQLNMSANNGNTYTGIGYLGIRGPVRVVQT